MKALKITKRISAFLQLMRPAQWIKNIFLFLPLFFAQEIGDEEKLGQTLLLFVGFCMLTSGVYIFNDLHDVNEDRQHPLKRFRPIASNKISPIIAVAGMLFLYGISCFCFSYISVAKDIFLLAACYIVLNIAYSLYLKRVQIIDAMVVACGFIIRLFAGARTSDIELSHWLIIMTFLLSLFLAFAKRRDDVKNYLETGQISRKNISGYTIEYLNVILSFLSAVIATTYMLYTLSPEVMERSSKHLYITIPFVLTGIMRYLQIILVQNKNCNPTDILLEDKMLQLTVIGWFIAFTILIY